MILNRAVFTKTKKSGNPNLNVAKVEACPPLAWMPQIRGVKGEAVAIYCKPLTTKEMGYHRLSHGVNNTVKKDSFLDITDS